MNDLNVEPEQKRDIRGPGSVTQDIVRPDPKLQGAGEYEYVRILNPLPYDFAIQVAQSRPVDLPFEIKGKTANIASESDVRQMYGVNLKNPEYTSKKHITNTAVIRSGQTINLRGDEAQVAVRQLVNDIAQQENKKQFLSDPTYRRSIEDRIVIARGSITELMDNNFKSTQQQINEAIVQSNEVTHEETAFPSIGQPTGEDRSAEEDGSGTATKRSRPAKTA